jgi:outer membrane immunogenic protein
MKFSLSGFIGLAVFAAIGSANAADLAARPYTKAPAMIAAVYDWSGFYIGGNVGWGTSHKCWDLRSPGTGNLFAEGCHDATGGVAGGQIGYRWQTGAWVFGVEAQGDWADLRGSNFSILTPAIIDRTKIDAFGLFTGQVGYAWNNVLWYLKGGGAVVSDKYDGLTAATGAVANVASETRVGGVVGTGIEYGFSPNWSAAIEYDHLFLGRRLIDFTSAVVPGVLARTDRIGQDVDLITVRVNYRWGGPVIAKY